MLKRDWWTVFALWIAAMLLRHGIWCMFVVGFVALPSAEAQLLQRHPFKVGEVLRYKVKWAFVRLGTVTIRQLPVDSSDTTVSVLEMSVQSAPALPFIDVNFTNQTHLSFLSQSLLKELVISGKNPSQKTIYRYDSSSLQMMMEDSAEGKSVRRDSVKLTDPCYGALGLLMLSRGLIGSGRTLVLPTLNDYRIDPTELSFPEDVEELEVDALDRPVRCRRVEGVANWVGTSFAGMKGPFHGWISDDEAAVPLKAKVEIFLGSIVLELESYERSDWGHACRLAQISDKSQEAKVRR
jgi:hypothetical protein